MGLSVRVRRIPAVVLALCASSAGAAEAPFDIIIENGRVIDGSGAPWYAADVGVRAGRIAAIGRLDERPAKRRIDARGSMVAPGFIDMLGQSEYTMLVDPRVPSKIYQGITSEITGEGNSAAPLTGAARTEAGQALEHYGIHADWDSFGGYFARLEHQGMGINLASYVGATSVREAVIGTADRQATAAELTRMRALVREAMQQGAVGLSTSLQYAPAPYASTGELIALAAEAARLGGIYATHMRSERDAIDAALEETFRIAREAHIPAEIWHLKVAGRGNWGRMPQLVARIEAARASGLDIAADTYAYTAFYNDLSAFVPPWAHEGGTATMIRRLEDPATRARIVEDMQTPSASWDNEWAESTPDAILIEDTGFTGCAVFGMREDDVVLALLQPWTSVDNDSSGTSPEGLLGAEHPHPRAYGTFPRILRQYVREQHRLSLEEAIRKFTSLPASRLRLGDRGLVKLGLWADLVVFDPDTVTDRSTFESPNQLAAGMQWVLVNGVPVIADGKMTGALPGRVLRGPGYRRAPGGRAW